MIRTVNVLEKKSGRFVRVIREGIRPLASDDESRRIVDSVYGEGFRIYKDLEPSFGPLVHVDLHYGKIDVFLSETEDSIYTVTAEPGFAADIHKALEQHFAVRKAFGFRI